MTLAEHGENPPFDGREHGGILIRNGGRLMHFTREPDIGSVLRICECCGFRNVPALIGWYLFKERCPALCLSCGYIEDQTPDTFAGWCPVCDTDAMRSALVLAGIL